MQRSRAQALARRRGHQLPWRKPSKTVTAARWLHLVGASTTGDDALALMRDTLPQVALLEPKLPGLDALGSCVPCGVTASRLGLSCSPRGRTRGRCSPRSRLARAGISHAMRVAAKFCCHCDCRHGRNLAPEVAPRSAVRRSASTRHLSLGGFDATTQAALQLAAEGTPRTIADLLVCPLRP